MAEEELSSRCSNGSDSETWETSVDEGRTKSKNKLLPDGFLDPLPPQKSSKLPRLSGIMVEPTNNRVEQYAKRHADSDFRPTPPEIDPSIAHLRESHRVAHSDDMFGDCDQSPRRDIFATFTRKKLVLGSHPSQAAHLCSPVPQAPLVALNAGCPRYHHRRRKSQPSSPLPAPSPTTSEIKIAGEDGMRPLKHNRKQTFTRGAHGLQIRGIHPPTPTTTIAPTTSSTTTPQTTPTASTSPIASLTTTTPTGPTASTSLNVPLTISTQIRPPTLTSAPLSITPDTPHSWPPYPPSYDTVTYPYYPPPYPHPHTILHTHHSPSPRFHTLLIIPPPSFHPYQLPIFHPYSLYHPPSSLPPQPITPAPPTPPETETPARDPAARIYIIPEEDTFNPSLQATHQIRDIIKSKFDGPYVSWKKIPVPVREMWFREFERYFTWLPKHHHQIRQNFERRGSNCLRDMLSTARMAEQRPLWIGEAIWAELCRQWATLKCTQLREKGKQNRSSDCRGIGTSLHTGGSIPHTEHRRRLKQALGRDPTMVELHARTHQHQKTQKWVDRRSEQIQEYCKVAEERHATSAQKDMSASQPEALDDFATWEQVAGGRVKGQIYGLGSVTQAIPSYYSCNVDSVSGLSEAGVQRQVELLLSAFNEHKQQMKEFMESQSSKMANLECQLKQHNDKQPITPAEPVIALEGEASTESHYSLD